ncbi:MAG TPA: hypothetical protein VIJ95_17630 [Hanamia sp.]
MERRFDMSDFEQSLKDHADQFILIPSKRVWNGIYNNLHPGSKWPSITVAIVLLITLVTIGNINNTPKPGQTTTSGMVISKNVPNSKTTNIKDSYSRNDITSSENDITSNKTKQLINADNESDRNNPVSGNNGKDINANENRVAGNSINAKNKMVVGQSGTFENNKSIDYSTSGDKNISTSVKENRRERINDKNSDQKNVSVIIISNNNQEYVSLENSNRMDDFNSSLLLQSINGNNNPSEIESVLNTDDDIILKETYNSIRNDLAIPVSNEIFSFVPTWTYSFNLGRNVSGNQINNGGVNSEKGNQTGNIKAHNHKKKNKNIEWVYYVAPVISTATFRGKGIAPPPNNYSPIVIYQSPSYNGMIYHAKLGFETGATMTYALSKKWKLVTGVNLNYSDYNVISNLLHPTFATLMLKSSSTGIAYSKSYITYYGNGQSLNQVALTNYNLQFSIPVGLEYQIWGNKKVQINLASTIGPSLVLKSNAHIISSDKRYYVSDPTLMRKMNLSGNFGPFISFSSRKVKWHIGPELNYQLLSTYKNYYPIKEHLIDYGIRIGISK